MDNKILEYQKVDMALFKLKKEINNSQNSQNTQNLTNSIKDCQQKILQLEQNAKTLLVELDKLLQVQKKGISLVEKLQNTNINSMNEAELKELEAKTNQTISQLAELENRISAHNAQVKKVVLDYEVYRKKIIAAKQKREELKQNSTDVNSEKEPQMDELKKKLQELEKQLEPGVVTKYRTLKQDGIFPVLVPLADNRCGGCRMQLSATALEKLKTSNTLECEQCRRIIFNNK